MNDLNATEQENLRQAIKGYVERKNVTVINVTLKEGSIIAEVQVSGSTDEVALQDSIESDVGDVINGFTLQDVLYLSETTTTVTTTTTTTTRPGKKLASNVVYIGVGVGIFVTLLLASMIL